jgi:hypothetical protein
MRRDKICVGEAFSPLPLRERSDGIEDAIRVRGLAGKNL